MNMNKTKTIYKISDLTKEQILQTIEKYNNELSFKDFKLKADAVFEAIKDGVIKNTLDLENICKQKVLNSMIIKP